MPQADARKRPGAFLTLAAWWCLLSALVLPALSYVGYPFYSLEYAAALLCVLLAGFVFLLVYPFAILRKPLLFVTVALVSLLYFYGQAVPHGWLAAMAGLALAMALAALLLFKEKVALRVVAAACLAQVVIAASATPPKMVADWDEGAARSDRRPVVHIVLDEHAGLAAVPDDPRHNEALRSLQELYVSAGFTIFPKAYTADNETRASIGRLFNPDENPNDVIGREGMFKRFALLDEIGRNRKIHITQFDYIRFDPWPLRYRLGVSQLRVFNGRNSYPGIVHFERPAADRLWIAASGGLAWFYSHSGFPAIRWLMDHTQPGKAVSDWIYLARMSFGYISRFALIDFRRCCVFRGTYYFLHTYFPHHPYIFERDCTPRRVKDWEAYLPLPATDTAEHYKQRWQMLLEQQLCASIDVMYIVKALDSQPHMRDALIIIHGDHGARILTRSDAVRAELKQDDAARARDQRGTFLAIRDGQKPGAVVDDDLRVDAVFEALVAGDFTGLNVGKVRRYPDSPYAHSAK